jgi:hypothetical protein
MMVVYGYIEQILNSPVYVFDDIIDKLIGKNIDLAKIELSRHPLKVDATLFESIKSILLDLNEEEGFISNFLYTNFGFEIRKNKRREQLIYLGSELKRQHKKIRIKLMELERQKEHLLRCVTDLRHLIESFESKNLFFEANKVRNKTIHYIRQLNEKIMEIEQLYALLQMRYNDLSEVEKIYHKLLTRIPRYQYLRDERELRLAAPVKI